MSSTWSLDQALLWIATRDHDQVESSIRKGPEWLTWLDLTFYVSDRPWFDLPHDKQPEIDQDKRLRLPDGKEWGRENLVTQPSEAECLLMKSIRDGSVAAYWAGERVSSDWFVGTKYEFSADGRAILTSYNGATPARLSPLFERCNLSACFPVTGVPNELPETGALRDDGALSGLIPSPFDQNRCAQSRSPMDMLRQG